MNDKIKTLFEKISKSEELKAELKANPPKSAEDLVAFAAKAGVELTVDEVKSASKKLSDENLEKISGGGLETLICQDIPCAVVVAIQYWL